MTNFYSILFQRLYTSPLLGDLLTLLAGGILPLAFAPVSWYPVAILSPACLFILWRNNHPQRAGWRGLLYGIGMFGVGISWVQISFSQFGNIPFLGALLLTITFVLSMALYPALLGWLVTRWFPHHTATKLLIILPATWTLVEWLRGWLFSGFPWLSLGYSQIDSPLNGYAPLLGVYGVSWLTVTSAGLLIFIGSGKPHSKQLLPLLLLIGLWGGGWLLSTHAWTQPAGAPLPVALIQGNVPQDFKWLPSSQQPTLQRYLQLTAQQRPHAKLIIWPESAIPLFYHQVPEVIESLRTLQVTAGIDFLIGIPVMDEQRGEYFNSVMSISDHPLQFYLKRHLVPFGEYIPFQQLLGKLLQILNIPMSEFTAGTELQPNLYAAGQLIGVSICYEDAFGELIRRSLPEATLLVNVSNDAWFGDSMAPPQHLEIARMRALETGRYLLRATNTGISAVIDTHGQITARSPQFEIHSLRTQAIPYQGMTPYVRMGNKLVVGLLILILLIAVGFDHPRFDHWFKVVKS